MIHLVLMTTIQVLEIFIRNLTVICHISQPADWEDREYIDDPSEVKPEVLKLCISF